MPRDAGAFLRDYLAGVRDALGENLVAVYPRGSLALGGYDPESSDIDVLVVTERPLSDPEFEACGRLHERLAGPGTAFHEWFEVSYIDRAAVRRFAPHERVHPVQGTHEPFARLPHRDNFVLERWIVREHASPLYGPDPKTLIEPIPPHEIRDAVLSELRIRLEDWADGQDPPGWLHERAHQAFEVQTVCRALCTLATGEMPTKPRAAAWALASLPAEWHPLIEWAREHRLDGTDDLSMLPEVARFARWAAAYAGAV